MPSQSLYVDIPVLPHVKSLMLSLYGPEPIKASVNNLPGKELQFIFLSNKSQPEKINGEIISILVSHRLAPWFYKFNNAFSLGCYFEKQFHLLLFMHVEAQRNTGTTLTDAIKNFLFLYKIDEELFNQYAATEAYRRLKFPRRDRVHL